MIKAHFNGGPYDDQHRLLERDEWYVPVAVSHRILAQRQMPDDMPLPTARYGQYRMRRDAFGQPVPHNLDGVVEFDWHWRDTTIH